MFVIAITQAGKIYFYNKNGQCHRKDGPAVILTNGGQAWYKNGNFIKSSR